MTGYLVIDGWNGSRRIQVDIVGETPDEFRIEPRERIFIPGWGMLSRGDAVLVSKTLIEAETANPFA
jgi:hypothetical protein